MYKNVILEQKIDKTFLPKVYHKLAILTECDILIKVRGDAEFVN